MSDRGLWPAPKKPPVDTQSVIDAVRPLIESDLRERLAAAIEAAPHDSRWPSVTSMTYSAAMRDAARIVRELP